MTPEILRCIQLRLNRGDDGVRDLILHGKYVLQIAVIAFGPEMAAGSNFDQLGDDAHVVAVPSHASLDNIFDAEILAQLLQ